MPNHIDQPVASGKAVVWTIAVALVKGSMGWAAGSMSLIVDSLNHFSHILAPIARGVVVRGNKYGMKAKAAKREPLAPFLFAAILLFLGFEALYHAAVVLITGEMGPVMAVVRPWATSVALIYLCLVVLSTMRGEHAAERIHSRVPSGIWPSVLALMGCLALTFAPLIGLALASLVDAFMALVSAILILRSGWRAAVGLSPSGSNRNQDLDDTEELQRAAQEVKGVIAIKDLLARETGHYVAVQMTVCVNPRITVTEGQDISRAMQAHLMERFVHIVAVDIKVIPYDRGYPYNSNVHAGTEYYPPMLH